MATREEVLNQLDNLNTLIQDKMNVKLNYNGKKDFLKLIKNHTYENVLKALEISINTYFILGDDESISEVFDKIEGILYNLEFQKEKPELAEINYLLKIAKNRFDLSGLFYKNIKDILLDNYSKEDFEQLKDIFCNYGGYTPLKQQLELYYGKE